MPFTDSIKMVDVIISDRELITASPIDVASGKVYIGSTAQLETGIMPVAEYTNNITLLAGETHSVPYGKIPQAYTVTAVGLNNQTSGTATENDILSTKTAWINGEKITGAMPNIGSESESLNCGSTHTISKGYHDGTGIISAASLASQTSANAINSDILSTKTAWVNGNKITGTMPNNGLIAQTINAGETFTIPIGYHDGTGTVTGASLDEQTSGTAIASDIIEGATAWVNGEKITGTIPVQNGSDVVLLAGERLNIPAGYYPNGFTVLAASLASQTDGTATAEDIIIDETAWVKGNKITGIIPDGDSIGY